MTEQRNVLRGPGHSKRPTVPGEVMMQETVCCVCGDDFYLTVEAAGPVVTKACLRCRAKYPASLIKAVCDPFDYAVGLTDGQVVRFSEARIEGAHATLLGIGEPGEQSVQGLPHPCPRGVDVRVDQIVWCADAPDGS